MLKTLVGEEIWLVSQPDHAAVSGHLAAHWGNEEFARPGYFAPAEQPDLLRAETILAVAEHDNGWWEWEADPQRDPADGLPLHLTDLAQDDGFERWRLGVPRFQDSHPYVALLISLHAYWLHAYRCESGLDPVFHHPLFGGPNAWSKAATEEIEQARAFVSQQKQLQEELIERIHRKSALAAGVEPAHLHPHTRLLQLADALSLALCFGGDKPLRFEAIPRRSWDDRLTLEISPQRRRIVCRPYPFDIHPLPVTLRARVLKKGAKPGQPFHTWWHRLPMQQILFEYCSG